MAAVNRKTIIKKYGGTDTARQRPQKHEADLQMRSPIRSLKRLRVLATGLFVTALFSLSGQVLSGQLNDTGITTCSDSSTNGLPCPQAGYPGQDAEHGRDAAAQAGTLTKTGGGRAGFDFTKLDASGNDLAASATSWSCVRDNVTGLIWEVKTDDGGLQDKGNSYSWYNPDPNTNGGNSGTQGGGSCSGGIGCDTDAYAQAVNSQGLCGYSDWRLPWLEELLSLVDYSIPDPGPTIDTAYFPNFPDRVSRGFWAASTTPHAASNAWFVWFHSGDVNTFGKYYGFHVRLVRGGQ